MIRLSLCTECDSCVHLLVIEVELLEHNITTMICICLSVHSSVRLSPLSVCLPACLSALLSVCLSVYLHISFCLCLSVRPSVPPVCLSVSLPICLSVFLSIYISFCLCVCLSESLSIAMSVYRMWQLCPPVGRWHWITGTQRNYDDLYLSVHPLVCLSFYLSIYLSVCMSVCLSISMSVYRMWQLCPPIGWWRWITGTQHNYNDLYLCPSVCLSVCMSVYLSVCLCLQNVTVVSTYWSMTLNYWNTT